MKRLFGLYALLWFAGCAPTETTPTRIITHPIPQGIYYAMHNDDYTVRVREIGGTWVDLYEYKVKVDMDAPVESSMVYFDFEGEVEVEVCKNNGTAHEAVIRPTERGIRHRLKENRLIFRLREPQNLSIEFDGDRLRNLHLFANAPEAEDVPRGEGEGIRYFGAGIHTPAEGEKEFRIPSNTDVYLAPGAVVKGTLLCDSVENVRIYGRGMLLTPHRGIQISFSKGVTVEDIVVVNPRHYTLLGGQSEHIKVRNIRSFSYQGWSDGIDLMSCSDVEVEGVFMRNSDDCIAVYGPRWEYRGDARNIEIRNSVLWADIAHPINIGLHGYTGDGVGNLVEKLRFRDIDILQHDEDDPNYQGCMSICCGDLNLVRDVLFEDIRVEQVQEGQLFHFEVVYNAKYCTAPGRGIDGVTLRHIRSAAVPNPPSIEGYDADHAIRNIQIEDVEIDGRKLRSLKQIRTNEYIEQINFL